MTAIARWIEEHPDAILARFLNRQQALAVVEALDEDFRSGLVPGDEHLLALRLLSRTLNEDGFIHSEKGKLMGRVKSELRTESAKKATEARVARAAERRRGRPN